MLASALASFQRPPRPEKIDDEPSERVQDCEHWQCDDSSARRDSPAVWNFRKRQIVPSLLVHLISAEQPITVTAGDRAENRNDAQAQQQPVQPLD
jgi:hypothetical protein